MIILYNAITILFIILYLPYLVVRGKWHPGLWQRLGRLDDAFKTQFADGEYVWLHAVSVGEVLAVRGLFDEILKRGSETRFVLSTVTLTGYALAKKTFPNVRVIFAPLDLSWVVDQYIQIIQPKAYITAETELWPNIISAMKRSSIPVAMVNGRISDGAFRQYAWVRGLLKPVLQSVDLFCMQTPADGLRIVSLGACPQRVKVTGNLKFENAVLSLDESIAPQIGFTSGGPLWVAGSTHPGEEEIVLRVFLELKKDVGDLKLILAPRHVERSDEVAKLIDQYDLSYTRLAQALDGQEKFSEQDILLVDTIGHLRSLYTLATMVFVGKSLCGRGGQNMIEPAGFAKPVVVGPNMQNFRGVFQSFLEVNAVSVAQNEAELKGILTHWLQYPQQAKALGQKALEVVQVHQGAMARTLCELNLILPSLS